MIEETPLVFNSLKKSFDDNAVLRGISTSVNTGDVIGLIGLNGAGKTTLLEIALGFGQPSSGETFVFGQNSQQLNDGAIKSRIGFVPQKDELMDTMNGRQYLSLIGEFYDNWNKALVDRLCDEWSVPLKTKIIKLSIGERQKLSIISALGHEPELIVLDEPVASLDPMARRLFLKEIVDIASAHTRSIIFSTHIVSDLERVASRVWLMKDGLIAIDEELDDLKEKSARIHLPPGVEIPEAFLNNQLIHHRNEQNINVLIFQHWTSQLHNELEQTLNCSLMPQWLSLEDIFLEIHV